MNKEKRGGKREGAGRPAGATKPPTKTVGIRLPVKVVEKHGINSRWLAEAVALKIKKDTR